jgi:hypothetical protein
MFPVVHHSLPFISRSPNGKANDNSTSPNTFIATLSLGAMMILNQLLKQGWQSGKYDLLEAREMADGSIFILTPEDDARTFHSTAKALGDGGGERYALVFRRLELFNKFESDAPYAMCTEENKEGKLVPTHTARYNRLGKIVATPHWPLGRTAGRS